MTINLDTLRKTAEAEETQKWGGWAFEEDDFDGFCIYINDGDNFGRSYVAKDLTQGESEGESTAEFIATFDPPTVLALLSRLEQAEQRAEQAVADYEAAEQQVARVRELADAWKYRGEHSMKYSETLQWPVAEAIHDGGAEMVNNANLIYRALDGDGRG